MIPTRSTYLFALAVIPSLMVWTSEAFAQQKLGYPPGRGSFVRYCGSCHGDDGKGNGPKAASLNPKPTDLTQLAKKNGGKFPTMSVMLSIEDVTQNVHGSKDMPVWGPIFSSVSYSSALVKQRIRNLAGYIESLQVK